MASTSENIIPEGREKERKAPEGRKSQREKSRDPMADMNARLAKLELAMADKIDQWEEIGQRTDSLESGYEELQGAVNVVADSCLAQGRDLKDALLGDFNALKEEIATLREEVARVFSELREVKGDWALCKMAVTQGNVVAASSSTANPSKVEVPKPKGYTGTRSAREIDNFLWSLEQYFRATGITGDAAKIDNATLYLEDTAMVWWRRRHGEIERGNYTLASWEEFKGELKRQFYPRNAEDEARAKLRRLTHKGSVREYVKEFMELLLEIPDFPEREAYLNIAISITESLVEFQRLEKKQPNGDNRNGARNGHHDKSSREGAWEANEHKGGQSRRGQSK